jgi:endogenous inhibitor of DNA gyrase (YacG/DUF329 family)
MDDLDRLFNHLVAHLQETAPGRLFESWQVSELYQRLLPYRSHRRQLGFESIEDYEMAVLRLVAGERDYARLDPNDAQEALAAETEMPHPNPGAFREFAAATLTLNSSAVRRITHHDAAYAPPEPTPSSAVPREPPPPAPLLPVDVAATTAKTPAIEAAPQKKEIVFEPVPTASTCPHCAKPLPAEREAIFCPFCGAQLQMADCRTCGEPVAPAWSYCLACGTANRRGRSANGG